MWAYYRIKSKSIPIQNKKIVERYKKDWKQFFEEITKYEDYHLKMYPQDLRLKDRLKDLSYQLSSDSEDVGLYYLDETQNILNARLGNLTKNDFIVGVKLKNEMIRLDADIKENAFNVFATVTDKVVNVLGWEQNVPVSFFNQFKELEESVFTNVSNVNGDRLENDELIYLNRYDFIRGLKHDVKEEMENSTVEAITNTKINPSYTASLKLDSDQDEGFVSFVIVDEMPHNMAESDLFFEAQSLPFEVEVNIKGQVEGKSKTKMNMNIKGSELNQAANEQAMSEGDIDDSLTDSSKVIRNLQNELKDNDTFLNNWLVGITVTGKTKKECLVKAKQVKRFFKQLNIKCHVPVADQLDLFYRFLPGEKLDITSRSWLQKTTQDGVAENLFAVNSDLGNKIGFFIGWVDRFNEHDSLESAKRTSRHPILHHPFLANQNIKGSKKRSPHVLITGDTGNGKSYLAKLLFNFMTFLNVSALYIDPKKEFRKWIEKVKNDSIIKRDYPLFVEHLKRFKFITLDHEQRENWGALDPITFLKKSSAKELLEDIFSQIYDFSGKDDVHKAFLQAINEVTDRRQKGEQVGSMQVIELMQKSEITSIKDAGDLLYERIADSILKLIVHDGSNKSLSLEDRISIIEIENIDLPRATDPIETYTSSQMKSNAIMMALGKFCELFGTRDKEENTAVFIDEAWMITASQQGKKVEKSMKRIGRSFNNALYFISQSTKDAIREEENETGNFGVAFAFDEENERPDILKWMNMEETEENIEMLDSMYQGQCLMKDMYGRSGKITIENLFEEWDGALETVSKSEVAYAEEKYL